MINLLPPQEKQALLLANRKKLVVILGMVVIIPMLCLILILASITLYVLGEVNLQKTFLEQAKKTYQTPDFLMLQGVIQKDNTLLAQLNSFYQKETYMSQVLNTISSIQFSPNVYATSITLNHDKSAKVKVAITGFAKTRDDLILFQKNIQGQTGIKNPSFSPDSWIDPKNVTFYLTFEVSQ